MKFLSFVREAEMIANLRPDCPIQSMAGIKYLFIFEVKTYFVVIKKTVMIYLLPLVRLVNYYVMRVRYRLYLFLSIDCWIDPNSMTLV